MATPVTLTFHLTQQFLGELTLNGSGNGVYAYLWNNLPVAPGTTDFVSASSSAATPATNYFTQLVLDGVQQGGSFNATGQRGLCRRHGRRARLQPGLLGP